MILEKCIEKKAFQVSIIKLKIMITTIHLVCHFFFAIHDIYFVNVGPSLDCLTHSDYFNKKTKTHSD